MGMAVSLAQIRRLSWWWVALVVIPGSGPVPAAEPTEIDLTTSRTTTTHLESSTLSPSERVRAQAWSLSEQEWRRYTTLMQGPRGSISPATISPIEVLGIHARDEAERRQYAERWARLMREDVDRILAFQRAYDEAGRRLFPGERLVDPSRLPGPSAEGDALAPADRVLFFARIGCPRCDAVLARVLARLERVAGIDIYLAGVASGDEQAVRDWASARGIQAEWVRSRRVTLNFDAGTLEKLTGGVAELPYLMRRRGEDVAVLPASAL
jgi:integrating conjugative element protein (TIGR03759 family)